MMGLRKRSGQPWPGIVRAGGSVKGVGRPAGLVLEEGSVLLETLRVSWQPGAVVWGCGFRVISTGAVAGAKTWVRLSRRKVRSEWEAVGYPGLGPCMGAAPSAGAQEGD